MSAENFLAEQICLLNPNIFSSDKRVRKAHRRQRLSVRKPHRRQRLTEVLVQMLHNDIQARCKAVNQRDTEAWSKVKSKDDWEQFCAPRIKALRQSLGLFPSEPQNLNVSMTRQIEGDGYRIENLVYESRAGIYVTANLYLPSPPREKMPAIILVHSHHNPKTQGELQDMGMTWARQGCIVLVMDQLSYGERRQHSPGPRQDYRFRYINGIQLYLIGDSLMGWMVWDVMRGVDLLLKRNDVDREKIILIGAVAGGGDIAAVAAAIDPRITCVIPFNFGGPQPETQYPLPGDAETTFNYMGGAYWESTRNLRLSGRDGFLHWVIVGSVAPRCLIYAHEFSWDKERDPVWKRMQKVFVFYNASDNLAFAHGAGVLSGRPPEATHCNNVGAVHRKMIHPVLERWFEIPIPQEYQNRLSDEELRCLTPELKEKLKPRPLHKLFGEIGASRAAAMRASLTELTSDEKRQRLCQEWAKLLGDVEPKAESVVKSKIIQSLDGILVERIVLEVEPNIVVPMLGLLPSNKEGTKFPVVVAFAQEGKDRFLKERSEEIAELLRKGIAMYLPDVRGTGETSPNSSRGRQSEATSISATELMLGQTLFGSHLRDLRSVLRYLRTRSEVDVQKIALWGDSFALTNPPNFSDPLIDESESPHQSEPLGGLLALFGALYEENIGAVVARRTLAGYQSVLRDRFCYMPYDVIVPGALTAGDLCDVVAVLAPRPLRLEALVDGRNCPLSAQEVQRIFEPAVQAYRTAVDKLNIIPALRNDLAEWLVSGLKNEE
ncbi:hypothetical protein FJZ31_34920 [Candidatus Poribacteria bacterium]|nr:hypothetical protein [Candidatus Poribacteria bacterium]